MLVFNDTTGKTGLIQLCETYTGLGDGAISGSALLLLQFTTYINTAIQKVVSAILESQDDWEWDDLTDSDSNGTYPIAMRALVSAQRDYSFVVGSWTLKGVETN